MWPLWSWGTMLESARIAVAQRAGLGFRQRHQLGNCPHIERTVGDERQRVEKQKADRLEILLGVEREALERELIVEDARQFQKRPGLRAFSSEPIGASLARGSARGSIRHSSQPRNAWADSGMAGAPRLAGMAKPPPSAYLGAMRRWAYILTLIVIWAASMAALALGLDGLLGHPPFVPYALISGAYFGALSTVS